MSTWIGLNFFFGALFVLAVVGVPLWMVLARPDTGPQRGPAPSQRSRRASASGRPSSHAADLAAAAQAGQPSGRWQAGVS
jgi:hypothetical protein